MKKYLVHLRDIQTGIRNHIYASNEVEVVFLDHALNPEKVQIEDIIEVETLERFGTVHNLITGRRL